MYDIMFDVELNKIKKRYGNIISFNIDQTCGFSFMNDEFAKGKTVAAIFSRDEKEFAVELKQVNSEYTCDFPDELCDSAEAYKLTVIAFTNDSDAHSDFRSTTAYYGTVEISGCDGTKFAPKHTESVFDRVGEDFTAELKTSLETATGESQDGKTWDELNNTVSALPVITNEQTQALGDYDLFKYYLAGIDGDGGNWSHQLFRLPPKDENGDKLNYKLPYIYTPNMKWHNANKAFCDQLLEVGVDVTKARGVGGESAPFATQKLQRLVMTGNANALTLTWFMNSAYALEYIKLETPNVSVLEADSQYYKSAFYRCEKLRTIDCELDFTGQTNTLNMFFKCFLLKDLRIKPFTLSTSLDLGDCRSLHHNDLNDYESLISILNAITDDTELAKNVTITFSNEITDFTTGGVHYWNALVYHCDNGIFYADPSEVPEGYAYLELPLYDAFIVKGVTIAWK